MISKTQRAVFEKSLHNTYRYNRGFYAKRVPEVTQNTILKQLQDGTATVRKKVNKEGRYTIEQYFHVPALENQRKKEEREHERADRRAVKFDDAYYKACDKLSATESHVVAAKIVADYQKLVKQLTKASE